MTSDRPPVTVLGTGAMGAALAETLLGAGHPTTVWNRTPGRADPLAAKGPRSPRRPTRPYRPPPS